MGFDDVFYHLKHHQLHGWKMPELNGGFDSKITYKSPMNGGFDRKITYQLSIFRHAMWLITGGYPIQFVVILGIVDRWDDCWQYCYWVYRVTTLT